MSAQKRIQPLFQLDGKVAIVTGASKGIGEAMARGLAEFGAKVVVSSRKREAVDAVAETFQNDGLEAVAIAANMGNVEEAHALVDQSVDAYGGIDIIVNNAAANPFFGHILDTPVDAFDKTVDVNLRGYFYMSVEGARLMREHGGGAIVNTASVNGLTPGDMQAIYSISKAAVISMTKSFAQECAPFNVRVNALLPGLTKTKFAGALFTNEDIYDSAISQIPMRRHADPKEMAGTVLYLVSDASSYVTGECVVVDGGMTI